MNIDFCLLPVENDKYEDLGSLLRLFQSEYFSLTMLMKYLNKYFSRKGIHDYLINQLHTKSTESIDFFAPQLWFNIFNF